MLCCLLPALLAEIFRPLLFLPRLGILQHLFFLIVGKAFLACDMPSAACLAEIRPDRGLAFFVLSGNDRRIEADKCHRLLLGRKKELMTMCTHTVDPVQYFLILFLHV